MLRDRMDRPTVSVVVPFLGDRAQAEALVATLTRLRIAALDEVIVADNTPDGLVGEVAANRVKVVDVADVKSASRARNAGAQQAGGEWLLFIDADCRPPADLIDGFFAPDPAPQTGIVAGEIEGVGEQDALLARWARSRRGKWVSHHISTGPRPAAVTANMLVRRTAFEDLGGFRIGGGGDLDLSWRAQERGWLFEYRPQVVIRHLDRERLSELAGQAVAYGGHQRHLRRLHGTAVARVPIVRPIVGSLAGAVVGSLGGDFAKARFSLVDGFWGALYWWGWLTRGAGARKAD